MVPPHNPRVGRAAQFALDAVPFSEPVPQGSGAIFREKAECAYFNFSLRGKHFFPRLQDHGSWAGDLRCVELPFFDFVCQFDPAQCYFRIPGCLKPQHWITSLQ
jgi:hypothetical protein